MEVCQQPKMLFHIFQFHSWSAIVVLSIRPPEVAKVRLYGCMSL